MNTMLLRMGVLLLLVGALGFVCFQKGVSHPLNLFLLSNEESISGLDNVTRLATSTTIFAIGLSACTSAVFVGKNACLATREYSILSLALAIATTAFAVVLVESLYLKSAVSAISQDPTADRLRVAHGIVPVSRERIRYCSLGLGFAAVLTLFPAFVGFKNTPGVSRRAIAVWVFLLFNAALIACIAILNLTIRTESSQIIHDQTGTHPISWSATTKHISKLGESSISILDSFALVAGCVLGISLLYFIGSLLLRGIRGSDRVSDSLPMKPEPRDAPESSS